MSVPVDESIAFEKSLKLALHDAKKNITKTENKNRFTWITKQKTKGKKQKNLQLSCKAQAQDIEKAFSNCQNMTHVQYIIDKMDWNLTQA